MAPRPSATPLAVGPQALRHDDGQRNDDPLYVWEGFDKLTQTTQLPFR